MSEIITVGLDLAKNVFQAHGADASGRAVVRKKLRRDQVLAFFGQLQPCVVAMEACGGADFWGREIGPSTPVVATRQSSSVVATPSGPSARTGACGRRIALPRGHA